MRNVLLAIPLFVLASQCAPSVHCGGRAAGAPVGAGDRALPLAFYSPDDFDDRTLAFDLPPAPSGKTVLVVTPGARLQDLNRAGKGSLDERVPVDDEVGLSLSVTGIDVAAERCPARTLPPHEPRALRPWPAPPPARAVPVIETREFRVHGHDHEHVGEYVGALARRVLTSDPYVLYEEVDNPTQYTPAQYAAIDAKLRAGYPEVVRRFGAPTDLDGNGRILVFLGHTVAVEAPEAMAYVDPCNLGAPGACADLGELVYVRSLSDMGNSNAQDDYAMIVVPDAILHETIHLAWMAHGWRRFGHFARRALPRFFPEGQAQLFAFSDEFEQDRIWKLVDRELWSPGQHRMGSLPPKTSDGVCAGPFSSPYVLGGLLFHWLRQRYGEGVDQAVLDQSVDYRIDDPIEHATGVPEPLAIATMFASLYFDGTPFGHDTGLELPGDDVRRRLPRGLPSIPLGVGTRRRDTSAYTGSVIYEVSHTTPVRVEVYTKSADQAYVLVAQP